MAGRARDWAEVRSASGFLFKARVTLSPEALTGVVATTMLFGQLAVELALSQEPDPMSRVPALRVFPVSVRKAGLEG